MVKTSFFCCSLYKKVLKESSEITQIALTSGLVFIFYFIVVHISYTKSETAG